MSEIALDKRAAVLKWLQNIFDDEPVPSFSGNEAFIDHLYELMTLESHHQKDTKVYCDFIAKLVQDYSDDLSSTVNVLNNTGLSECVAAPSVETDILASIASTLNLSTLDESSYILALTDELMCKDNTVSDILSLRNSMKDETRNLTEAKEVNSQLESVLDKLSQQRKDDKDRSHKLSQDTSFLQNKAAKYAADRKKEEMRLSQSGVSRELTHECLVSDYNELQELNKKLLRTEEELSKYAALPPDKQLAKIKVEVARSELRDIEDELARQIDISHI